MFNLRSAFVFAAVGLSTLSAKAAVLTFDGPICGGPCVNSYDIDADYGSTASVAVSYNHDVTGAIPGDQLNFWDTGYSDLINVAFGGGMTSDGEPAITLTPLGGATITLEGFDLGAWRFDRATQVTIVDGASVVYSSGPITVLNSVHTHFSGPFSSTDPITIQWGPTGYYVAIDNVSFTVSGGAAVPELSTWAMLLAGFAGFGLVGLRASRKATISSNSARAAIART